MYGKLSKEIDNSFATFREGEPQNERRKDNTENFPHDDFQLVKLREFFLDLY